MMKLSRVSPVVLMKSFLPLALAGMLVGCAMPNSSNPTLSLTRAQVSGDRATLDVQVDNPSDMDVQIEAVQWSLMYGPLPVAEGTWQLGVPVARKGSYRFTKQVAFTSPALDPSADEVELSGTLDVTTHGNTGETSLKGAGFVARSKAQH